MYKRAKVRILSFVLAMILMVQDCGFVYAMENGINAGNTESQSEEILVVDEGKKAETEVTENKGSEEGEESKEQGLNEGEGSASEDKDLKEEEETEDSNCCKTAG